MGHLTTGIKVYAVMGSDDVTLVSTARGIILDAEADRTTAAGGLNGAAVFPHAGRNRHHIIYATPVGTEKISIDYSLDGTSFFTVFTAASTSDAVYWDTGRSLPLAKPGTTALGSGGGSTTCPPPLVRITATGDANLELLSVLTYGTVVR